MASCSFGRYGVPEDSHHAQYNSLRKGACAPKLKVLEQHEKWLKGKAHSWDGRSGNERLEL